MSEFRVKYTESNGVIVTVRCRSSSLTNGKVRQIKRYTAATIDWIAVYDKTSDDCYYVPAAELGDGRDTITLRLQPTRNSQRIGVRYADAYTSPDRQDLRMEAGGIEPPTRRCKRRVFPLAPRPRGPS